MQILTHHQSCSCRSLSIVLLLLQQQIHALRRVWKSWRAHELRSSSQSVLLRRFGSEELMALLHHLNLAWRPYHCSSTICISKSTMKEPATCPILTVPSSKVKTRLPPQPGVRVLRTQTSIIDRATPSMKGPSPTVGRKESRVSNTGRT
ncbi:hypothetical protein V8G54_024208 [Vigna mungo]|uniref:Secreted protein n=1 Tax=Vigna mungo TaxID=3915 RepID=A0AAQ3N5U4_VIGMU